MQALNIVQDPVGIGLPTAHLGGEAPFLAALGAENPPGPREMEPEPELPWVAQPPLWAS